MNFKYIRGFYSRENTHQSVSAILFDYLKLYVDASTAAKLFVDLIFSYLGDFHETIKAESATGPVVMLEGESSSYVSVRKHLRF